MQDKPQNYRMSLHECYGIVQCFSYSSFLDPPFLGEAHVHFEKRNLIGNNTVKRLTDELASMLHHVKNITLNLKLNKFYTQPTK